MEDFLIAVLLVLVVWLIYARSSVVSELNDLVEKVGYLEARVRRVEDAPRPQVAVAAPPQAAAAPHVPQNWIPPQRTETVTPQPYVAPVPPPQAATVKIAEATSYPGFVNPRPVAPLVPPVAQPAAEPRRYIPPPPPPAFVEPKHSLSLEERLGKNWLNKLGIVALVVGIAGLLGYKLKDIGPAGRSIVGMTLALVVLGLGVWMERRDEYRLFARVLIGGGWALTFFVTFALYHVTAMQVLQSQGVDLALMFVVAAAMVAHSLKYKSQVVTSLAFALAFLTVGISEVTMFSLVAGAILAASLAVIVAREYWFEMGLVGVVGVYFNHFLWLHRVLPDGGVVGHPFPEFTASAGLLLLYWLIFRLVYVLRVPRGQREETVSSLSAVLNSVGLMSLLKYQSSHPEWAFYGLLVLGVAEMVLAFVARKRWRGAFVLLASIASMLLIAAVPFRYSGANWSLLWLLEAEMLFVAGIAMKELVFRRLGMIAGMVVTMQVMLIGVGPIFTLRQGADDALRHPKVAIVLLMAAVLFWFNAEFARRRWSFVVGDEIDGGLLLVTSYMALAVAGLGLWVCVPGAWTLVAWMLLVLALGVVADRFSATELASQSDILAIAVAVRAVMINFQLTDAGWGRLSLRAVTVGLTCAMLYAAMRRKTLAFDGLPEYVAAAYSWVATVLFAALLWREVPYVGVVVAWGVFALVLFELGKGFKRDYLRAQSYALLIASFVRIFIANLDFSSGSHASHKQMWTVLALIAAYYWIYERLQREVEGSLLDRAMRDLAAWFGAVAGGALLAAEIRVEWVGIAWAVMAVALLLVGWLLKRALFLAQALVALAFTLSHAVLLDLMMSGGAVFTLTRSFVVGTICAVLMLLGLPVAFAVRRRFASEGGEQGWKMVLYRPEQPFFFVPLVLIVALLALELRAGMITVGWVAAALVVFLFALAVGERSYRLAGLGLLMLGVGKILVIDIWNASTMDRYITLIVMGAALLLVSFLYTRYRETLLELL